MIWDRAMPMSTQDQASVSSPALKKRLQWYLHICPNKVQL